MVYTYRDSEGKLRAVENHVLERETLAGEPEDFYHPGCFARVRDNLGLGRVWGL